MTDKKFVFIYIIAKRKLKEALEKELYDAGGALIGFVYGRGYHESKGFWDFLGFGEKSSKLVISCLVSAEKGDYLIDKLNKVYSFENPDTGIAFTIPVEVIVF